MLSIDKLELSNFITYKNQLFDFNKLFTDSNLLLIYGKNIDDISFANDNGAGKSIIYESLLFLLFNRTTKNSNKDILIGEFNKSMNIEGILTNSSNDKFWIKRYRKDKIYGNNVRFKINDKEIKKGTQTELTNLILQELGISYRRVMNTSIFESNDEKSRFVYLGDKDGKSLLAQMKGLGIFSRCEEIAKNEVKDIEIKIDNENKKLNELKILQRTTNNNRKDNIELSKEFEDNKKQKILVLKTKKKKFKISHTKEYEKKSKSIRRINKEIKKLNKEIEKVSGRKRLEKELETCEDTILSFSKHIGVIEEGLRKAKRIIKGIKIHKKLIDSTCDYCGSQVRLSNLKEHLNNVMKWIKIDQDNIMASDTKLKNYKKLKLKLKKKIQNKERKIINNKKLKTNILSKEENIIILKQWLNELKQNTSVLMASIRKQISEIEDETNTHNILVDKLNKQITKIKLKKKSAKELLEEYNRRHKIRKVWCVGFGKEEIQSHALKSTVNELNIQIKKISEELTNGTVDIELLTEKKQGNKIIRNIFEFKISDLNKKDLPFKEWSKGQKKRIEIIVNFALMNIESNLINEIFLDELFDGIDEVGIVRIKNMLEKESINTNKRFIIFSHSKNVKQMFPNRAYVRLKNGRSKLIQ